ncbi:hypothetical protein HBI56_124030 [Parastagonospora nodorum]|uniref:Uncharacterized protein n=1 Tax=Phaeosphaeria nodorum (strain SN15 / ATCC MYA-4574 / FGSC 10173) TaxID=321614 RepID=A0A7U2F4D8_PHANO|nr:hypothetical protein HBH56_165330 [Parastagonospora nodorum]QRC98484.1 hypothetical protein JI435_045410 [Parastagonospora nodorum SN15]KAH3936332.1 hypothetical protein HBH54_028420 [Parastagonospora nodorum]KAH3948248.1 hypothetical protein HBH53_103220 [Parastagonospora nodorum]KAH3968758.1 hypothetical protein HBH51_127100 [Parastagonospora nodorum]
MAPTGPPRRFKVEPIETSTSSSKDRRAEEQTERPKLVRKFAPEPLETTTKSNRKFAPEPVETTVKTNRKFAPEPVETTQRTNRRFAPEPVETSQRTNAHTASDPPEIIVKSPLSPSRQRFAEEWGQQPSPRRFKPEPLGTTSSSNRKPKPILKRASGKFSPQLIETAQRHRKASDNAPALYPADKTDATPDTISRRRARILGISPSAPVNSPSIDVTQNPLFLEVEKGYASCPLARRRSYFSSSQHSFRIPDLDPIESSESEASTPSSPSTSPLKHDHSFMYTEVTRRRESIDDASAGYLLELAAKTAEKQLREQAMAAFPNDDYHEPIAHYVTRDSDELDSLGNGGRSFTEINWELEAMQKYQENQKAEKEKEKEKERQPDQTKKPAYNPFGNPAGFLDSATAKKLAQDAGNPEMARMRKSARPPMLGSDIRFPRCDSPEPSRFDPTQGCDAVKTAMCYLSEQTKAASEKGESLWCGQGNGRQTSTTPSLWSTANSRASSTHGLWGGMCISTGDKSPRGPTGILTPMHEKPNPMSPCPTPSTSLLPPTPPASTTDFSSIDEKLAVEQTIADDFSDDFVTQVYNYLSLGYPSMARPFDAELSKISGIPLVELRQDDHLAASRGYIRLGKDGNLTENEITEETCSRWRALRIYIQEWARQHPNMAEEEIPFGGRGTAVRKGSWAL